MCGIAGYFDRTGATPASALESTARAMAQRLAHRGPDGAGVWADPQSGIAFGHTRLAIIDLTQAGHQPMQSKCGRFCITYNGELYNTGELRAELEKLGHRFRGTSDTEVLVEGCAQWGVGATVAKAIGMFAFGVWDNRARRLTLVRDRLGIKPLYWGARGDRFFFASELKALKVAPGWEGSLDAQALGAYLRYSYVPAPATIYAGVHKLEPGKMLELEPGKPARLSTYWSLDDVSAGHASPLAASDPEVLSRLEALLLDAVGRRMVADVPLGAFLSGGIDSSLVVALMQAQSTTKVRSFSIGFDDDAYNEADHAKAVASHLGTDHTELYVSAGQARAVIPRLAEMFDEPFADSSQIPTFLVSQMAREHVTVALSGDGGDEVFAGYNRYATGQQMAGAARVLPLAFRKAAASAIRAVAPGTWDQLFRLVPAGRRPAMPGDKMHKFAGILPCDDIGFYSGLLSQYPDAWRLAPGATEPGAVFRNREIRARFTDPVAWMQYLDTRTYLPDDILTKVDRASMAVSLEMRVPLLDHRVVEFAWRLPAHCKIRRRTTKWALRAILGKYVPASLFERPKMGFGVPIDAWLRGPLKEWAGDLLLGNGQSDLIDMGPVRAKWAEHQAGTQNWQYFLWNVLMLQAWQENEKR
ncbi:MAG: asparagine synthase (glutamine-hydrolyzing) [Alphaproteobacteria bacterium]